MIVAEIGDNIQNIFQDGTTPWAVDMDGTLIYEDISYMTARKSLINPLFWPLFLWSVVLLCVKGPAGFFRFLESRIPILPHKELTFNTELQCLIESHRARGGKAVLVTGSHVSAARAVVKGGGSAISNLFVDVWGSCMKDDIKNEPDMVAERKAAVLDKFLGGGGKGFIYAGNSVDDLKVWSHSSCKGMVLVNCEDKVLQQALTYRKPFLIVPRRGV